MALVRWCVLGLLAAGAAAGPNLVERWDKPKRASLQVKATDLGKILAMLTEQCGTPVAYDQVGPAVDFDAKDLGFFEALDRLGAENRLFLVGMPVTDEEATWSQTPLTLVRPAEPMPKTPVAYIGPSRLSVESISVTRVRRFVPEAPARSEGEHEGEWCYEEDGQQEETNRLRITLKWIVERGFRDATLAACTLDPLVDSEGAPLVPLADPASEHHLPLAANSVFAFDFVPGPPGRRRLTRLSGRLQVLLPAETTEITFLKADIGRTLRLGGSSVTLTAIDGEPSFSFTLVDRPCAALAPHGEDANWNSPDVVIRTAGGEEVSWIEGARIAMVSVYLYDADGKEVGYGMSSEETGDGEEARWQYKFTLTGKPAKVVFRAVTKVEAREATFAFENLPLPE